MINSVSIPTFPRRVSKIALGTASFGESGLEGESYERAVMILDSYYERGGRLLDTANVYGRWGVNDINASEHVIGRWIRERKADDVVVISKCCHHRLSTPKIPRISAECAESDLDESRRALGLDTIPIMLLHRDDPTIDIRVIVEFMAKLVDSGKIERFGLSNYRADRVKGALDALGDDAPRYISHLSNEWNLAMEGVNDYTPGDGMVKIDRETAALCRERNLAISPFSAAAHGFFEKLRSCGAIVENGEFKNTENFRGNRSWLTKENAAVYEKLLAQSEMSGKSLTRLSLEYLMNQPQIIIPVVSVSRVSQLDDFES